MLRGLKFGATKERKKKYSHIGNSSMKKNLADRGDLERIQKGEK